MIVSDINEEKLAYKLFEEELDSTYKGKDRRKASTKKMLITGAVAAFLVVMTLLYVWVSSTVNRTSYILNDLRNEIDALKKESDMLNLKIAELKSLDRIEREAIEKLNMKKPEKTKVLSMAAPIPQKAETETVTPVEPERVELAGAEEMRKVVQSSILTALSHLTVRWFSGSFAY